MARRSASCRPSARRASRRAKPRGLRPAARSGLAVGIEECLPRASVLNLPDGNGHIGLGLGLELGLGLGVGGGLG